MKIKNTLEYYLLHFLPVIIVYFFHIVIRMQYYSEMTIKRLSLFTKRVS